MQHALFEPPHTAPLSEAEKLAWLRLSRTENIGPMTCKRLIERYGTATKALSALPDLAKRGGRAKPLIPTPLPAIEKEYTALHKLGGHLITLACDSYPYLLSITEDAPPVLSVIGNPSLLKQNAIAMVGARNASLNGRKMAEKLARDLGMREQIIVSGLARGIDTAAHQGALSTGTIAVVAGGIDVIYPEENASLYNAIKEQGLILAESPLGQKPFAQSFPRRNRIVSGLSRACIVMEATMRSGSLITARLAGEQGREVMATPGSPLDPRAEGPNHLIREGATLIRNANDVLEALLNYTGNAMHEPFQPALVPTPEYFSEEDLPETLQDDILALLTTTPVDIDSLLRETGIPIPALQSVLLDLELAERIKRLPGNRVCLTA